MSESQVIASEAVSATTQLMELDQVLRQRMDPEAYAIYEALAKERILSDDKFRVDLEKLRLALGWAYKTHAKTKLVQNFIQDEEFIILDNDIGMGKPGRPVEVILLTLQAAHRFARLSQTRKSKQIAKILGELLANDTLESIHNATMVAAKQTHPLPYSNQVVYLATCPDYKLVKIGMWRGTLDKLRARYLTYYGPELQLSIWHCKDARAAEKDLKRRLHSYHRGGELYTKDCMVKIMSKLDKMYERALA